MRLTRNTTTDGKCKYAIVRLDRIRTISPNSIRTPEIAHALSVLEKNGVLEYGEKGTEEEHFVLKLKDEFAYDALRAYHLAVRSAYGNETDIEVAAGLITYCAEIRELFERALTHPSRKRPD